MLLVLIQEGRLYMQIFFVKTETHLFSRGSATNTACFIKGKKKISRKIKKFKFDCVHYSFIDYPESDELGFENPV